MINFYRSFIRGEASILKPKHRKVGWQPDMEKAFKKAKVSLSQAAILATPNWSQSCPFLLMSATTKCWSGWLAASGLLLKEAKLNGGQAQHAAQGALWCGEDSHPRG